MPSSLSHAMFAFAAGSAVAPRPLLRHFLILGSVCAVLPDIDAIGRFHIDFNPAVSNVWPYDRIGDIRFLGGHRAFTHSLMFAALLGVTVACATLFTARWQGYRVQLAIFITFVTAAHGVLDAFTSIAATTSPVRFFTPFSSRGYTSPWQPIDGPNELFWCLLPLVLLTRLVWHMRRIPWPKRPGERPITIPMRYGQ